MTDLFEKTLRGIRDHGKWPSNSEWLKLLELADSETKRWNNKYANEKAEHSNLRARITGALDFPIGRFDALNAKLRGEARQKPLPRVRRSYHDCNAHKPGCPVHQHPENPDACNCIGHAKPGAEGDRTSSTTIKEERGNG